MVPVTNYTIIFLIPQFSKLIVCAIPNLIAQFPLELSGRFSVTNLQDSLFSLFQWHMVKKKTHGFLTDADRPRNYSETHLTTKRLFAHSIFLVQEGRWHSDKETWAINHCQRRNTPENSLPAITQGSATIKWTRYHSIQTQEPTIIKATVVNKLDIKHLHGFLFQCVKCASLRT